MAPNAQTSTARLDSIFTGLKSRNLDTRVQYAQELRRFVSSAVTISCPSIALKMHRYQRKSLICPLMPPLKYGTRLSTNDSLN